VCQQQTHLSSTQRTELIERYQAGERAHVLARAYGIHRATVAEILERAGVRRSRSMTVEERQEAVSRYAEGWSCARIGELLGRDASTVHRALVAAGVRMRDVRGWERTDAERNP
jgi:DNA-directed RNA polymerase specialized sigma24 family protein